MKKVGFTLYSVNWLRYYSAELVRAYTGEKGGQKNEREKEIELEKDGQRETERNG